MSLNWNLDEVENYEELFVETDEGKRLDGLTESFIWQSMVTGLGKNWSLDADFAPEFYARVKLIEKLNGPLTIGPNAKPVTIEDVLRRVGLHVNVSPVSRAQFIKNCVTADLDRDKRKAEKARADRAIKAGEFS